MLDRSPASTPAAPGAAALASATRGALCEKLPGLRHPLLPYAPEIETAHRLAPRELPQGFSHLALISACVHLIREDERIAAR
jgi:hypothetical protein